MTNDKKYIINNFKLFLINKFLGNVNIYYKYTIILFMIVNPILFFFSTFFSGWLLIIEFIFILIMSLKCYPLVPGGLIVLQAVFIGMTSTANIKQQIFENQEILFILIFMVPGVQFIKKFLLFIFTKILFNIRSKIYLSLTYFIISAFLSAFLDAITVIIVIITVTKEIYTIYHSNLIHSKNHFCKKEMEYFKAFLRSLVMQASIGSTLGGAITMIGEPQNIIIAKAIGWDFFIFFKKMYPVTIPVILCAVITSIAVEKFKLFGYGYILSDNAKRVFFNYNKKINFNDASNNMDVCIQFVIFIWLIIAITLHLADISLIGLSIIILSTSLCGINNENSIGKEFTETLPFVSLLIIFFVIVSIINQQKLFYPIINFILQSKNNSQIIWLYFFNGFLSAISDNVFIGSIFINEIKKFFLDGIINFKKFETLAITINAGTNFLSIATPNGQAALLFLLTSRLSLLIDFSYKRILFMTLPFTFVVSITGLLCVLINIL